jgi:hypothetical protein
MSDKKSGRQGFVAALARAIFQSLFSYSDGQISEETSSITKE